MIPAEAVEAAAKAMFGIQHEEDDWKILPEFVCEQYRREVTSILEAAAPYMLAASESAYDAGFTACAHEHTKQDKDPGHPITRTNPYRSQP